MKVKCIAQEHNAVPWLGLKSRPLDLECNVLTIDIRPPHHPFIIKAYKVDNWKGMFIITVNLTKSTGNRLKSFNDLLMLVVACSSMTVKYI